jgi:hypothetical protein
MPKLADLPPGTDFSLGGSAPVQSKRNRSLYVLLFFLFFLAPLVAVHLTLLDLPFFWDEHGQFIPAALDLLRTGAWIPHSTIPNVHPPGVELFLTLWYKIFGYSIPITRFAMLCLAALGLLVTFFLTIELGQATSGAPAFLPPLFLLVSPLFFTQSMMAQLDMPAMVLSLLALLLFLKQRYALAAVVSCVLVLTKETGIVFPFVFFTIPLFRKSWKEALFFTAPALVLGAWLGALHWSTGYWLGNPGFAHYNVEYSLHPVRIALSFFRRIYYLLFAEFRWIGTAAIVYAIWKYRSYRTRNWLVAIAAATGMLLLVTVLGGAELERYLLPVLPIFYIAATVAITFLRRRIAAATIVSLTTGLVVNLFWNPPYPFPYENNLAMIDFVKLQQSAAQFVEQRFPEETIATAWPYTAALQSPDYGFVHHPLKVVETEDFHPASIREVMPGSYGILITYTRTWAPPNSVIAIPAVRKLLARFYEWEPAITREQCEALGMREIATWGRRGQQIAVYVRKRLPETHARL